MIYDEFSLTLNKGDILSCATFGDCDGKKDEVARKKYVQSQLKQIPKRKLTKVLDNMGIEYDKDSRQNIESLVVWDAACWLKEDVTGSFL